jgi:putative spermidine/putrescine transport system permease protein
MRVSIWKLGAVALRGISWATLLYLVLPLMVIVGVSFSDTSYIEFPPRGFTIKWYAQFLQDPSYVHAFKVSIELAVLSTITAVILAIPAALIIARKTFRGRALVSTLFLSPLVLPNIVIGIAILQYANSLGFARTFSALLIGHIVIVLPYVLRTVLASLVGMDVTIEEAAQDLGATSVQTFFLVTLPQIKPGIIAGSLFAFIISWINIEVTIFNSTGTLTTLPVKLFYYIQNIADPTVAAVSAVTVYIAIIVIVVVDLTIGLEKATSRGAVY